MSTSTRPAAAFTAPGDALELACVTAAPALAASCEGCATPAAVALGIGSACNVALGRAWPATDRRTTAASLGANAGPSGVICVAWERWAAPAATSAGLSPAGAARSRFAD